MGERDWRPTLLILHGLGRGRAARRHHAPGAGGMGAGAARRPRLLLRPVPRRAVGMRSPTPSSSLYHAVTALLGADRVLCTSSRSMSRPDLERDRLLVGPLGLLRYSKEHFVAIGLGHCCLRIGFAGGTRTKTLPPGRALRSPRSSPSSSGGAF